MNGETNIVTNLINQIIKNNEDQIFFTKDEEIVINKYTDFYHLKVNEKIENFNYLDPDSLIFMNDGYAEIDDDGYPFDDIEVKNFILNTKYKNFKYQVALYKQLLDFAKIKNNNDIKVLVDIGCGKGGGVSFYKNFYNFDYCIGIDLTRVNIDVAKKHEKEVNFFIASATNLPINDNTVDVITSVESIFYYDPMSKFAQEAFRVLKDNGKLLISADLTEKQEKIMEDTFLNNGLVLYDKKNITKNVRMGCCISKSRFMDISFSESIIMSNDETKYFGENKTFKQYKNFIFIKKENNYAKI